MLSNHKSSHVPDITRGFISKSDVGVVFSSTMAILCIGVNLSLLKYCCPRIEFVNNIVFFYGYLVGISSHIRTS